MTTRADNQVLREKPGEKDRVLVAMSGGVDSSVAVGLLLDQGYDCVGATMELGIGEQGGARDPREGVTGGGHANEQPRETESASEAAARVAAERGITHHVLDLRDEFARCVIDPFVQAYLSASTPNPCIRCNRYLKFGRLLAAANEFGCDKIATGHYARISYNEESGRFELRRAADLKKDQSYVLYTLTQEQLSRVVFPLGELTKEEAREFARAHGFANAEQSESQDICFIPDGDYAGFIHRWVKDDVETGLAPGNFVDEKGEVLGTHRGLIHYTIGQRKGLNLPSTEAWYVTELRAATNEVVLGRREAAYGRELITEDFNWVSIEAPSEAFRAKAKARYRHEASDCEVTPLADGRVRIVYDEPQWAITRGQAVVVYDGDLVLGGGTIE